MRNMFDLVSTRKSSSDVDFCNNEDIVMAEKKFKDQCTAVREMLNSSPLQLGSGTAYTVQTSNSI